MKALLLAPERDRFLLQRRRKPGDPYDGFWELPGGRVHRGESIHHCLMREVAEETGLHVQEVLGQRGEQASDRLGGGVRVLSPLVTVEVTAPGPIFGQYYACQARGTARDTAEGNAHRWITPAEFRATYLDVPISELSTVDLLAMRLILDDGLLAGIVR
ncbi:MAG: NUDIX domain-containing protein [Candidatus Eisenbacteria bacterium]|uniref:NUDIX domain-containing protein n=1 Tax=Eiseniibacteriota bacterium TaxID=2212470 RepID=A0A956RNX9_UNCEI|nr:NUDIX domain-containing protein [Candidatus Eisenbacteria bacterium]